MGKEFNDLSSAKTQVGRMDATVMRDRTQPTQPIKTIEVINEEFVVNKQASFQNYAPKFAFDPKSPFRINPLYYFQKEEKLRSCVEKIDSGLSRFAYEHNPLFMAPSNDLMARIGYTGITEVKSSAIDTNAMLAARCLVRFFAELDELWQQALWLFGFIRTRQSLVLHPLGGSMVSFANFAKISTALSKLNGLPVPKWVYDTYFKISKPSSRYVTSSVSGESVACLRIPMVTFGVEEAHTIANKGNYVVDALGGGKWTDSNYHSDFEAAFFQNLNFFFAPMDSLSARQYGWVFSPQAATASAKSNNKSGVTVTSDEFVPPYLFGRLEESLINHVQWVTTKLLAMYGDGENGITANVKIGNAFYNKDNSVKLMELLKDPTIYTETVDFNERDFSDAIVDNLKDPVDDFAYVMKRKTMNSRVTPVIQRGGLFQHKCMMPSFTIFGGDDVYHKSARRVLKFQKLSARLLSFYKSSGYEVLDTTYRSNADFDSYSFAAKANDKIPDPSQVRFRPEISFAAFIAKPTDDDAALELTLPTHVSMADIDIAAYTNGTVDENVKVYSNMIKDSASKTAYVWRLNQHWRSADNHIIPVANNTHTAIDIGNPPIRDILGKLTFGICPTDSRFTMLNKHFDGHFISGNIEPINFWSSMDNVTIFDSIENAKLFMGMDMDKGYFVNLVDVLPADDDFNFVMNSGCSFRLQDDVEITYEIGTGLVNDTVSKPNERMRASQCIKPWTLMNIIDEGDNLTDLIYNIDYLIMSAFPPGGFRVERKKKGTAWSDNDAKLAYFQMRPTSFDCGLVDFLNIDNSAGVNLYAQNMYSAVAGINILSPGVLAKVLDSGIIIQNCFRWGRDVCENIFGTNTYTEELISFYSKPAVSNVSNHFWAIRPYAIRTPSAPFGEVNIFPAISTADTVLATYKTNFMLNLIHQVNLISYGSLFGLYKPITGLDNMVSKIKSFEGAVKYYGMLKHFFTEDICGKINNALLSLNADTSRALTAFERLLNFKSTVKKDDKETGGKYFPSSSNKKRFKNKGKNKFFKGGSTMKNTTETSAYKGVIPTTNNSTNTNLTVDDKKNKKFGKKIGSVDKAIGDLVNGIKDGESS